MTTRLCVIPGCRDIGQHSDDCTGGRCRGCQPRHTERPMVCTSCRVRLAAELAEIGTLHAELSTHDSPTVERGPWMPKRRRPIPTTDPTRSPAWAWVEEESTDRIACLLPAGPVTVSRQARISGSREQAAPVNLDQLDLSTATRPASRALHARGVLGLDPDQVGTLSTATILDSLVRTWRDALCPDQHLPLPTVPIMVDWLAKRLDDACDRFLAIDEAADEIRELRNAMRGVLGLVDAKRELCHGVPCRSCDRMSLYRDGLLVSCGSCGLNYSERDYREWVGLLDADTRERLEDGELEVPEAERPLRIRSGSAGNGGWQASRRMAA